MEEREYLGEVLVVCCRNKLCDNVCTQEKTSNKRDVYCDGRDVVLRNDVAIT